MTDQQIVSVWAAYFASKATGILDPGLTRILVEHYYPLVTKVANRLHRKITEVEADDLGAMGVSGLYDAVRKFDTVHKTKFETYATARIRGSILDAIRSADWVPRLVRAKASQMDKRRSSLESTAGHRLTPAEMSEQLGMTLEEYQSFSRGATSPTTYSMNDTSGNGDDDRQFAVEYVEDKTSTSPSERLLRREMFSKLLGTNFTPQERTIIKLYYYDERSMKDISDIVGISESRVSQMHTTILNRLRNKAERNPGYFSDIFNFVGKFKNSAIAI